VTVPLDLAGLPATTRDGRLRNAISSLIATARQHGARAVVIEDPDFAKPAPKTASGRGTEIMEDARAAWAATPRR
jgi:hypothetical protein